MKLLIDSANLNEISEALRIFPLSGVTMNPTLMVRESKDWTSHLERISEIVDPSYELHFQIVGESVSEYAAMAEKVSAIRSDNLFLKVPIDALGIEVMKILVAKGYHVTGTAAVSSQQAVMAACAGVAYIAPYFNRIENIGNDGGRSIAEMVKVTEDSDSKILAASFKNTRQIIEAILKGADSITASYEMLRSLIEHPLAKQSIETFNEAWYANYGK